LPQLEQEGQQLVSEIRRQSLNPLDPARPGAGGLRATTGGEQSAANSKSRSAPCSSSNARWRELVFEQIVTRAKSRAPARSGWATNLVQKLQVAVLVRDGVIESIEGGETTAPETTTSESISL